MALPFMVGANWVIPLAVTIGGTIGGWIFGKGTEGHNPFRSKDGPLDSTNMETHVTLWSGYLKSRSNDVVPESIGGVVPAVTLWGEKGEYLGMNRHTRKHSTESMPEGNTREIVVSPIRDNNQRADYLSLTQWNNDGICISAIQIKHANGDIDFILGDIPAFCGWPHYPSQARVTFQGEQIQPPCFWLDADNSGKPYQHTGKPEDKYPKDGPWIVGPEFWPQSVNFHIPDFMINNATLEAYRSNKDLLCRSSRRMQAHPDEPQKISIFDPPLEYGRRVSLFANGTEAGKAPMTNTLLSTIDNGTKHSQSEPRACPPGVSRSTGCGGPNGEWRKARRQDSAPLPRLDFSQDLMYALPNSRWTATEVCDNMNMVGPSYLSREEGKYCDLVNRKLLPVCAKGVVGECFDVERDQVLAYKSAAQSGEVANVIFPALAWTGLIDQAGAAPDVIKTYTNIQNKH